MLNIVLLETMATPHVGSSLMWIVFIALTVISMIVSKNVERKFKKYSHIRTEGGITGRDVAERMLRDHDIHNVQVQMVKGTLTDHYNPANRTLNLSPDVYNGTSVAAAAVAAHECGHAVQHAVGYAPLGLRSALVPIVSFAGRWVSWVILAGLLLIKVFPALLLVGILLFAMTRRVRCSGYASTTSHLLTPIGTPRAPFVRRHTHTSWLPSPRWRRWLITL